MIEKYYYIKETSTLIIIDKDIDKIGSITIDNKILYIYDKDKNLLYKQIFKINIEKNINKIVFSTDIKESNIKIFEIL